MEYILLCAIYLVAIMIFLIFVIWRIIPSKKMIAEKEAQLIVDKKQLNEFSTKQLLEEIERRTK